MLAPVGRAAPQHREPCRARRGPARRGACHGTRGGSGTTGPPVQRDQQQVRPGQVGQCGRRRRAGLAPPRTAARRSGPAPRSRIQELPLTRGDPGQVFRFQVLATGRSSVAEFHRRARQPTCPPAWHSAPSTARSATPGCAGTAQTAHRSLGATPAARSSPAASSGSATGQPGRSGGSGPRPAAARSAPAARPARRATSRDRSGHVIGQHRQRGPALLVVQDVHVIEDQRDRRRHRRERGTQPRNGRAGHRTGRRGPARRTLARLPAAPHPAPRRRS